MDSATPVVITATAVIATYRSSVPSELQSLMPAAMAAAAPQVSGAAAANMIHGPSAMTQPPAAPAATRRSAGQTARRASSQPAVTPATPARASRAGTGQLTRTLPASETTIASCRQLGMHSPVTATQTYPMRPFTVGMSAPTAASETARPAATTTTSGLSQAVETSGSKPSTMTSSAATAHTVSNDDQALSHGADLERLSRRGSRSMLRTLQRTRIPDTGASTQTEGWVVIRPSSISASWRAAHVRIGQPAASGVTHAISAAWRSRPFSSSEMHAAPLSSPPTATPSTQKASPVCTSSTTSLPRASPKTAAAAPRDSTGPAPTRGAVKTPSAATPSVAISPTPAQPTNRSFAALSASRSVRTSGTLVTQVSATLEASSAATGPSQLRTLSAAPGL